MGKKYKEDYIDHSFSCMGKYSNKGMGDEKLTFWHVLGILSIIAIPFIGFWLAGLMGCNI